MNTLMAVQLAISASRIACYFFARIYYSATFETSFSLRTALLEYLIFYASLFLSDLSMVIGNMVTMGIFLNSHRPFEYSFSNNLINNNDTNSVLSSTNALLELSNDIYDGETAAAAAAATVAATATASGTA